MDDENNTTPAAPPADDSLTPGEASAVEDGQMTGEEAHRFGEFEDLRDRIEGLDSKLDAIASAIEKGFSGLSEGFGVAIDNGMTITDSDDGSVEDKISDAVEDLMDLDNLDSMFDMDLD